MNFKIIIFLSTIIILVSEINSKLVELTSRCSKLRYTPDQFTPFPSEFQAQHCYLNENVIDQLCELQDELFRFSASELAPKIIYLKILECYRNEQEDNQRYLWALNTSSDSYPMRKIFYPNLSSKSQLRDTYIQNNSLFQNGNTVGLTLSFNPGSDTKNIGELSLTELAALPSCFAQNGKRKQFDSSIEMGNFYYCFDVQAQPDYINDFTIYKNRQFLKLLMEKFGFIRASYINSFQFTLKQ